MKKIVTLLMFLFVGVHGYAQTAIIDSLLQLATKHSGDTNEIKVLQRLGAEFMRKDTDRATGYVYQQISLAKSLKTDFGLISAYSDLVMIHQNTGNMDSAAHYLNRLEVVVKKSSNKKAGIEYARAAGLYYKNQGKYKEALPYLLEALRLLGPSGDKTARAGQSLNLGNIFYDLGDLKSAADYHLKALALFEEVKNKRGESFCLQGLGSDFFELEQYALAEKYLIQSEKIKTELGDRRGQLTSWMTLGSVYQQTKKHERAMIYFNKALERARELKLSLDESRSLFNIGSLLKAMKKPEASRTSFTEALALARKTGDSVLVSRIKTYLVLLQNDLKQETKEEQTLLQNIQIATEKGSLNNTVEGHLELADWYAARNEFEKAFMNLRQGQKLNDSIRGNDIIVQFKRLEEEYKNEKKEKEIALLKKDQELHTLTLSRQKIIITSIAVILISVIAIGFLLINRYRVMNKAKRLIEIERVRNNIARDLHDDIGSALSSINILSQVAMLEKNGSIQNYLQRIGDQSARIMEDMSDMVWSINPRNDSINQVIVRMREFAAEILELKKVEYKFTEQIEEGLTLTVDQRKNVFLIFKEIINNAAKYSNANLIEINLLQQAHTLILKVKDNGQGFNRQTVKTGNGIRNLEERAKEIKGKLILKSIPGTGTEMELQLPIA